MEDWNWNTLTVPSHIFPFITTPLFKLLYYYHNHISFIRSTVLVASITFLGDASTVNIDSSNFATWTSKQMKNCVLGGFFNVYTKKIYFWKVLFYRIIDLENNALLHCIILHWKTRIILLTFFLFFQHWTEAQKFTQEISSLRLRPIDLCSK